MISKMIKIVCIGLVWYLYVSMITQALFNGSGLALVVSILYSFAALMVFPPFKGGGI